MTTTRRAVTFSQFGGLRLDMPADEIGGGGALVIEDVDWNQSTGGIRPRMGASKVNSAEGSAVYSALGKYSDDVLLAVRNSETKKLVAFSISSRAEFKEITWAGGTFSHASYARFGTPAATYGYAFTDLQKPIRFDGTTFTEPTATVDGVAGKTMPKGRYACVWGDGGNRLVIGGTNNSGGGKGGPGEATSTDSHVWFSEPGNAESWESTAYVQVTPGDGEPITGCCTWGPYLFVFKMTRMFVFYGVSTDEEGRPIFNYRSVDLGTVMQSPFSGITSNPVSNNVCVAGDAGVYLLTQDGVYLTSGSRPILVSAALSPAVQALGVYGGTLALAERPLWWRCRDVAFARHRLYVSYVHGGQGKLLVYDTRLGAWTIWRTALNSMTPILTANEKPLYFAGDGSAGNNIYCYDEAQTTDPSKPIAAVWQSGFYDFGSRDEKTPVESKLWGKGKVTLSCFSDLNFVTADFSDVLEMPSSSGYGQIRSYKSQPSATYFSHRVTLEPGAELLSIDRYLREGRTATTKTT